METEGYTLVGIVLMYFQSWLKRFEWYKAFVTAFPAADKYVHRMVAALTAFVAAVGITYTMTGDSAAGWQVAIAIPNQAALLESARAFLTVFISQQFAYDISRRPAAVPHDRPAEQK